MRPIPQVLRLREIGSENSPSPLPRDWETARISTRHCDGRGVGHHRTYLQVQRYLAARHQHRDDDRYFLDGLPHTAHSEPGHSRALQVKLDELILAPKNARNDLVAVEEQPEDKIEKIKDDEKMRARK